MTDSTRKYLFDIQQAIDLIEVFAADTPVFSTYQSDLKTKSAIERQLAIVGEALNQIKKDDNTIEIKSSVQIIGLRHRLIHAYDSTDDSIIWAILVNHLPQLKLEILELLAD